MSRQRTAGTRDPATATKLVWLERERVKPHPLPVPAANRTWHPIVATAQFGESPGGVSPPGAPRAVREPLDSYGSRCSAVSMA
jgi:hypothetical protein